MFGENKMNYDYLNNWFDRATKKVGERGNFLKLFFQKPGGEADKVVDFHGHTTISDGKRTPEFYEKNAKANHVDKFVTTDHDNIGNQPKNDEIKGMEVICRLDEDNEIEILVYNFDYNKAEKLINDGTFPYLQRDFKVARNVELARRRLDICNKLGLTDNPVNICDILQIHIPDENGEMKTLTLSQIGVKESDIIKPGQPVPNHVEYMGKFQKIDFDYLIRKTFNLIHNSENGKKFLKSKAEEDPTYNPDSTDHFLKKIVSNKNGELYVKSAEFWPSASQVIEFAKETGGVAILAHPFGYNKKINITTFELVEKIRKLGIDGIEVWHGFNQSDEVEFLYKYAFFHDLLITMGTDTHEFMSDQGDPTAPGTFPGVRGESRYTENNIFDFYGSLYNLHKIGSGANRGLTQFDCDNLPASIDDVFLTQQKRNNGLKHANKNQQNQAGSAQEKQ